MNQKVEKALLACDKVIDGIEDETITTSSALLLCLKIARLTNDADAIIWLQYECSGYPLNDHGYIEQAAFNIANKHGRGIREEGKTFIFSELAAELEEKIYAQQQSINNFTTNGVSVGGDHAYIAMENLTRNTNVMTSSIVKSVILSQKMLSKLKANYYEFALTKQIELKFGNAASGVFDRYRQKADVAFSSLSKKILLKLQALEGNLDTHNPEKYSQALTTCRRLLENVAEELFEKHFHDYNSKIYQTKSGKQIDVSEGHYKNKLSAVIEKLTDKASNKTLVGSNIIYLLDWIANLVDMQCKGVHAEVTEEDAERCIIQTYICLGDILSLQSSEVDFVR